MNAHTFAALVIYLLPALVVLGFGIDFAQSFADVGAAGLASSFAEAADPRP